MDGTWEVTTTRAELLAAGAGPDEDSPENYGHSVMELRNGIWAGADSTGIWKVVGTYRLDGNKILFTLTTTADAGVMFHGTWELVGGTLKLGGGLPTPMRVKPYTRVAAAVTPLEGQWAHDVTHAQLLAAGIADPAEDNPGNIGHFGMELRGGTYRITNPDGSTVKGTFTVDGNKMLQKVTDGEDAGNTWTFTWELAGGLLTLGGEVPAPYRATPWTKVGP